MLANVLNGVLVEQLLVSLCHQHDWDGCLVHYVLDEGLKLFKGFGDFDCVPNELDVKVQAFAADEVCLASEHQLQVDVQELLGEGRLKPFLEIFKLVFDVGRVAVLAEQTVGNFGSHTLDFPLNALVTLLNLLHIFSEGAEFSADIKLHQLNEKVQPGGESLRVMISEERCKYKLICGIEHFANQV